jgi:hypothetical protein
VVTKSLREAMWAVLDCSENANFSLHLRDAPQ